MVTFDAFTISVFIRATQAHSAWPSIRDSVGYAQLALAMVLAAALEETASSAYQWALLSGLLA